MFIGHFAVGFAAKRFAPKTSLALLVLAPLFLDVVWPVLILAGVEQARVVPNPNPFLVLHLDDMPWSHSLLMAVVWAALFGGVYLWRTGLKDGAAAVAVGVVSHWVLDWITHRPDMMLWPGGARLGLGLWNSVIGTAVVEGTMFLAAVVVYARMTRARRAGGTLGFWSFVALLAGLYALNLATATPPTITAVAVTILASTAVMVLWIRWFDDRREVRA